MQERALVESSTRIFLPCYEMAPSAASSMPAIAKSRHMYLSSGTSTWRSSGWTRSGSREVADSGVPNSGAVFIRLTRQGVGRASLTVIPAQAGIHVLSGCVPAMLWIQGLSNGLSMNVRM
jgi:hypothetical protein